MKIELLKEPNLEFGNDFVSDDPKLGLSVGGCFSLSNKTHRSEINYGIIGTQNNIADTITWINKFDDIIEASSENIEQVQQSEILDGEIIDNIGEELENNGALFQLSDENESNESEEVKNKRLNPDFIGFNHNSNFKCEFQNDESNNIAVKDSEFKKLIANKELKAYEKAVSIAEIYVEAFEKLISTSISKPNVCLIVIPSNVFKACSSTKMGMGKYFNFRRYLKARLIGLKDSIPVQILLEDTILQKRKSLQDLSMQAWNFCVANYYKNNCTPWTLSLKDKNTCFIGISFHKVVNEENDSLMRASIAQAFNFEGKGIIFIGKKFKWDDKKNHTHAPHLTYDYSKSLIADVISEYKKYNSVPPSRVVIHKTTDFWSGDTHEDYAEVEGLKDGITSVLGDDVLIDLVSIKNSDFKLLRSQGKYPVIRGTLLTLDQTTGVLYTTGYIPIYETFPGVHIPRPIEINIYEGEAPIKKVAEEILALTKLNFNNCNYYDSLPITLRFAQKVGEIIQYMDEDSIPPNKYFYYM